MLLCKKSSHFRKGLEECERVLQKAVGKFSGDSFYDFYF